MRFAEARIHFIGVGGIGMCGLAELLHNMGAQVTGSDSSENAQTARLKQIGIRVFKGHAAVNLGDAEVVVYSSAVQSDNCEYHEARRRHIPLIRRAEALAGLMNLKRGVAVGGTHGKTTTTSLVASIFLHEKLDPTIIVGGRLDLIKSTAQLGRGEWLIAEADESDGSFTHLSPEVVILTNIDNDHLDYYKNFANLKNAFMDFASRIPFYGVVIACGDDVHIKSLFATFGKRWISYGTGADNDYVLTREADHWAVHHSGQLVVELRPAMPGLHNALNSLAAMLAAQHAGISLSSAAKAIREFGGVDRRFQHKAKIRGVDFYDDYGHHPTEIRAVLSGFKEKFPHRRLVTVFQPHRYSRTQLCWNDFLTCFAATDVLFLLDIYAAGEAAIPGVTGQALVEQLDHPCVSYLSRQEDPLLNRVRAVLREGDILLTLGAGDISKLGDQFSVYYTKD